MTLPIKTALTMIEDVFTDARSKDMVPMTVCIVDAGGAVIATAREDGSSPIRPKVAYGKAHGAAMMGMGSRALFKRAQEQAFFIQAMNALSDGALVPVPGGVLIRENGKIIGAMGITGASSDEDEALAIAAIEKAGYLPDAG